MVIFEEENIDADVSASVGRLIWSSKTEAAVQLSQISL